MEEAKVIVIRDYAATQMQAVCRGFADRSRHRRRLQREADLQLEEVKRWSILSIQKVARGFIARKTFVRSYQIRKQLSKEVLRIAESYLKNGDLWGFLKDINDELKRANEEIKDNTKREDDWATSFVEKVVSLRQKQFDKAWDSFPKALSQITNQSAAIGSLIDDRTEGSSGKKQPQRMTNSLKSPQKSIGASTGTHHSSVVPKSQQFLALEASSNDHCKSQHVNELQSSDNLGNRNLAIENDGDWTVGSQNTHSPGTVRSYRTNDTYNTSLGNVSKFQSLTDLTNNIPGPMARKAVRATVDAEVSRELKRLLNGEMRSRQLVEGIKDVYGKDTNPDKMIGSSKKRSNKKYVSGGGPSSSKVLSPVLNLKDKFKKKRKKKDINGRVIESTGKIEASHAVWMANKIYNVADGTSTLPVQPGEAYLIDIPHGIEDSIERLLHAASLRCYVPPFFIGAVQEEPMDPELEIKSDDEETIIAEKILKQRAIKRKQNPKNQNSDPSYAYEMYLSLPIGLAKMRYELECKKFSQGPINRLKIKGLNYITDAQPLSKFIMCLKSVDTPRVLINKAVEICIELKKMGLAPVGATHTKASNELNRYRKSYSPRNISLGKSVAGDSTSVPRIAGTDLDLTGDGSDDDDNLEGSTDEDDNGSLEYSEAASIDMNIDNAREPVTLKGLREKRERAKKLAELPSKLLLQMVEEDGAWCSYMATVEELFQHAAFLVVPHVRKVFNEQGQEEEVVTSMSNQAFKEHSKDVLAEKDENIKREMVKSRFRSALILATPYCIYLKNNGIHNVQELLKCDWKQLQMPAPLETQIETLLTIVVAKASNSKVLPVVRDHLSTAEEMFMVPMLFDPKFQRSPFDPFGRPPRMIDSTFRIQKKVPHSEVLTASNLTISTSSPMIAALDALEAEKLAAADGKMEATAHLAPKKLEKMGTLTQNSQKELGQSPQQLYSKKSQSLLNPKEISKDLSHPISMWQRRSSLDSVSVVSDISGLTTDQQWSFQVNQEYDGELAPVDGKQMGETTADGSKLPYTPNIEKSGRTPRLEQEIQGEKSGMSKTDGYSVIKKSGQTSTIHSMGSRQSRTDTAQSHSTEKRSKSAQYPSVKNEKSFEQSKDFNTRQSQDLKIFKNTFVCTYPHCNQVFSRNYTYKIHLKSHELFSEYHLYKKNPQLALDSDSQQVAKAWESTYEKTTSLPPIVQMELSSTMNRSMKF